MENQTPIVPPVTPQVAVEQPLPAGEVGKQSSFLTILLSVLLLLAVSIAGFFAYQTQKLVAELRIKNEELTIKVPTPTTTPDPTADWKTYTNSDFGYKYPSEWNIGQGQTAVVSDIAGVGITNFKKDMPMYNECMKKDKTDVKNDLMVKYYSYDLGTEACSNQANINNKEIWVTKADGDGYQPGIIIEYNTVIYPKSLDIIDQILSTFKFID